jgi:diguanylate cyclase (GGDEF)-like protein
VTAMRETGKQRIIVVDDDRAMRELLRRQLVQAGYDVVAYDDGRAALQLIAGLGSGIILADWSMPGMDGLELCRAVRELEALQTLRSVYFILLTAHGSKDHVIEGLGAGANDYLTKPYHSGELLARIHVGARFLRLQDELLQRTLEYHKANAQLAVLTQKLEKLANTDALTGLANRRRLFARLGETWELSTRRNYPLSCIMLDLDRFKGINDTHGHDAGDRVLCDAAEIVRSAAARPELCARFGGEEFVVLCPGAPAGEAVVLAETIRQAVAAHVAVYNGTQVGVTISCGVAERTAGMADADALLRQADTALYAAKERGRNRTYVLGCDGATRAAECGEPVGNAAQDGAVAHGTATHQAASCSTRAASSASTTPTTATPGTFGD